MTSHDDSLETLGIVLLVLMAGIAITLSVSVLLFVGIPL